MVGIAYSSFRLVKHVAGIAAALVILGSVQAFAAEIEDFVGTFSGSAEVQSANGSVQPRDMSVEISETKKGFRVSWSSTSYKPDGRTKEKAYQIDFVPSDRQGVFAAAMKKNVFGHEVQLDPMKGEPYVWGRIIGDTMTVYSLFVDVDGGYEVQQFDRTLSEGGLMLEFNNLRNGEKQRTVSTFLTKE